jgi:hypothetical protein
MLDPFSPFPTFLQRQCRHLAESQSDCSSCILVNSICKRRSTANNGSHSRIMQHLMCEVSEKPVSLGCSEWPQHRTLVQQQVSWVVGVWQWRRRGPQHLFYNIIRRHRRWGPGVKSPAAPLPKLGSPDAHVEMWPDAREDNSGGTLSTSPLSKPSGPCFSNAVLTTSECLCQTTAGATASTMFAMETIRKNRAKALSLERMLRRRK